MVENMRPGAMKTEHGGNVSHSRVSFFLFPFFFLECTPGQSPVAGDSFGGHITPPLTMSHSVLSFLSFARMGRHVQLLVL